MRTINKSAHTKKPGSLCNDPRIYIYLDFNLFLLSYTTLCRLIVSSHVLINLLSLCSEYTFHFYLSSSHCVLPNFNGHLFSHSLVFSFFSLLYVHVEFVYMPGCLYFFFFLLLLLLLFPILSFIVASHTAKLCLPHFRSK